MLVFFIILLLVFGGIALLYGLKLIKYNQSPLQITTFDGSNSPYHPSVKYRENGYGGFNYIMSETPFYLSLPSIGDNYRDQYECPSIHYSHDGIHWKEIINNPIDNLTEEERKNRDYFSDSDLVETPMGIECWYRINRRYGKESNQENVILLRKKSVDGIEWSEREIVADLQFADLDRGLGKVVISQTLLYEEGKYKCWFVDNIHLGKEKVCYSESVDAISEWCDKKEVKLKGLHVTPWHLHILKDKNIYWLTIYDHQKITLWKGSSEIEFQYIKTLIEPSGAYGSFYSNNTYRACLTKIADDNYRLYFSADDMFRSYIGVMEGHSPEAMSIISVDNQTHSDFLQCLYLLIKTNYKVSSEKLIYYTKRIYQKSLEIIKIYL